MVDEAGDVDLDMEEVLRRSEMVRRNVRARRQTRELGGSPHSSSPTESGRRGRSQYASSPLLGERKRSPAPPVIEEIKRMPASIGISKNGLLAQQIHEEFLCCKICLDSFTNPKSLNCLHTFCEECIENHANSESSYKKYSDYREFTCPLCRKRTSLPLGGVRKLPDNFLVSSLTEVIDRQKPSKFPLCDMCKLVSRKHSEASSKCLDCNKTLCKDCVDQHLSTKVTKNHNIFDIEIEKEIECKEHSDEVVRFYCESCETAICILCTFNDHKDHDVSQFSDAVQKYKGNIENLLKSCKTKLEKFDQQLETVGKCESIIRATEQKIKDITIDMIAEIRSREKTLIAEVHNLYGADTMELIGKKNELQANHDALKSTVQLTDLVVQGKDMELLLLKKEVQQKLETLSNSMIQELPKTASKVITYVPGMIDMGYIHDSDNPLQSAKRRTINMNEGNPEFNVEDYISTVETQTELSMDNETEASTNTESAEQVSQDTQTDKVAPQPSYSSSSIVLHEPIYSTGSPDLSHRSRYSSYQGSFDDSSSRASRTTDDDSATQRRRRRRERARTTRIELPERYSYPSDSTPPGVFEQQAAEMLASHRRVKAKQRPIPVEPIVEPTRVSKAVIVQGTPEKTCELQ